ncbi:uroporphyrinogen-III synthase [Amycolatopsis acidiphila]|uniref:Uroporphyrinogen-III synthase n=1 Tax=Amycolatopsis acidiphila TaxID=715473 RepID=A0A557ZTD0_9PSEU|nr:uroporphyrinogen-III synthase [Amycolatopsis acidiphila]TVT15281.1 uroporphyrinogen-III synthase [Amycolatopsis acidiphila]UIJ61006.1 uroporphyrinogen-III synthase [Amycolatopsis acidiphila]GHG88790.1 uroporphyrinogen III methyltransferase [Amycolatopsis acidiphila]
MGDLRGVTIGVTAERRADEFIGALERNGATVRHAPTIHIVPLPDDLRLRAATDDVLAQDVDLLAVTTGAGFRGWLEAADGWGLSDRLLATLGRARIFTRGPKGKGAVRGRGLSEAWSAPEESNRELFAHLLATGVEGKRVAVQLHGSPLPETQALADAGARLIEVQPYRWEWPADLAPAYRLLDGVLDRQVQALAFTSAPATSNLLSLARRRGSYDELVRALKSDVVCACVGPVTAAPLTAVGVPTLQPERQRLGALVKLLVAELGG